MRKKKLSVNIPSNYAQSVLSTNSLGNHYENDHNILTSMNINAHLPPFLKRRKNESERDHLIRCCKSVDDKRLSDSTRELVKRCCWVLAIIHEENEKKSTKSTK